MAISSSSLTPVEFRVGARYFADDMLDVARDTAISTAGYTQIYHYDGKGWLLSFVITLEGAITGGDPMYIKLVMDTVTSFELKTDDVGANALYNLNDSSDANTIMMSVVSGSFRFSTLKNPLYFRSGISIHLKKVSGATKKFRAGLINLIKVV